VPAPEHGEKRTRAARSVSGVTCAPEDAWFNPVAQFLGTAYLRNAFTRGTEQEVAYLVDALRLEPGQRVLDVGCGPGRHSLALARRGLEVLGVDLSPDFLALARDKTPRGYRRTLRESAVTQARVAQAEAQLGSARVYLLSTLEETWAAVGRNGTLGLDQRVRIRLATSHAIAQAREVADFAYHAAGASAIFDKNPFEHRFRDIHTVAQQLQGRDDHFENVGRFLLDLSPDTTFL